MCPFLTKMIAKMPATTLYYPTTTALHPGNTMAVTLNLQITFERSKASVQVTVRVRMNLRKLKIHVPYQNLKVLFI